MKTTFILLTLLGSVISFAGNRNCETHKAKPGYEFFGKCLEKCVNQEGDNNGLVGEFTDNGVISIYGDIDSGKRYQVCVDINTAERFESAALDEGVKPALGDHSVDAMLKSPSYIFFNAISSLAKPIKVIK